MVLLIIIAIGIAVMIALTKDHALVPRAARMLLQAALAVVGGLLVLGEVEAPLGDIRVSLDPSVSVQSPSGDWTAIKQYVREVGYHFMDENERDLESFDIVLIKHDRTGNHALAVIRHHPQPTGGPPNDGIVLGWEGDHHLIVEWPFGESPVAGPKEVGGVTITYRSYFPRSGRS